jgi:hypothetical protein
MDNNDETPELLGIIAGAAIGVAPVFVHWYTWGRFHPDQDLAFGFPAALMAVPVGLLGAVIGYFAARVAKQLFRRRQTAHSDGAQNNKPEDRC